MFVDHEGTDTTVFEAVRATATADVFDSVRLVEGLRTNPRSLDLSWDGLRIYYTNQDGELYFAERPTRDAPFDASVRVLAPETNFYFPSVSPDELELFYNHTPAEAPAVYYRRRSSRTAAFGAEQKLFENAGDADVAASSRTLVIARDRGLYTLERACP